MIDTKKTVTDSATTNRIPSRSIASEHEQTFFPDPLPLYNTPSDLKPGYWFAEYAAMYLNTTTRKISLYRKYGLLRFAKFGKNYVYKKEWLDEFADTWAGYDLSNESKVKLAIREREWRTAHGITE